MRWKLLAGAATLALVLPFGCSMLPEFSPAVDTPAMRAGGLASHSLDVPPGRLHYVTAGQAAAGNVLRVLFVHGSPGTWNAWEGWLAEPRLRERARLIAPDRPGFGGSNRGKAEPSLARQAAALVSVLAEEPGKPAIVVGHSLGGPIAAKLAMDRPDLVAALLLVAPSIDPALEKRRWFNYAGATLVVQWFLPVDWIASNRELWPLKSELEAMVPAWRELDVPTIVVQGMDDDLVPPGNAAFAERVLAGRVDVRRIPGAGHFVLWQQPESVTGPLLELLDGPSRDTQAEERFE